MRPRLAWNSQPFCLGLLGTGITLPLAIWAAFERSTPVSTLESMTSRHRGGFYQSLTIVAWNPRIAMRIRLYFV